MFHLFSINVTKVVGKLHFIIIQITDFYTYSSDEYGYLLFVYIHLVAKEKLFDTNKSISEIAYELGFRANFSYLWCYAVKYLLY